MALKKPKLASFSLNSKDHPSKVSSVTLHTEGYIGESDS